jgi:hypothetical protein
MQRKNPIDRLLRTRAEGGHGVVQFLNEEQDEAARAGVLKVFELCRRLDAIRRETYGTCKSSAELAEHLNADTSQKYSELNELNAALRKFQFVPALLPGHKICWRGLNQRATEPGTIPAANFVKLVLDMTEDGTLDRVRQCFCRRWFFAQTNKKTVCSDACRFQKFKHGDQKRFKKKRAAYMREYRNNPRVKAKRRTINAKTKAR